MQQIYFQSFLLFFQGCQSDKVISVNRQPPAVTIQEPSDGARFFGGEEITFLALTQTFDGTEVEDLTHQWVANEEVICLPDAVEESGYASCSTVFDDTGEYIITVTITHEYLASVQATITINIDENQPPTITIVNPQEEQLFPTDELVLFEANVSDPDEPGENLFVSASSNIDGDLEIADYATSSGEYSNGAYLTVGEHLITMTVEDSIGRTDQDSTIIVVYDHGPPSISTVNITPPLPTTLDDLIAEPQGWSDLDNSPEQYIYRWFVMDADGNMVEDVTETTVSYPSAKTAKGMLIQVEATPFNDYGQGSALLSTAVEIINIPPTMPTVSIDPANPHPDDNLYCIAQDSTDSDGDSISYTYKWLQNGVDVGLELNVLDASYTSHGDSWECQVTPSDGQDNGLTGSAYAVITDAVAPDPPLLNDPPAYVNDPQQEVSGLCEADCTLTFYCEDGTSTWTDTQQCEADGTFVYPVSFTLGQVSTCYATCEDSAGNLSGVSNTIQLEVCDPQDGYEQYGGDDASTAIDQWGGLSDDGTVGIAIVANILSDDSDDWYVISAVDDINEDFNTGIDYFNFAVTFVSGSTDYSMVVYSGAPDVANLECSNSGYTSYSDFNQDIGEADHVIPTDARACGNGAAEYNNCEDNSKEYYIHVFRKTAVSSCQGYELNITNGVW